jgi:hypothetical protein
MGMLMVRCPKTERAISTGFEPDWNKPPTASVHFRVYAPPRMRPAPWPGLRH